MGKTSVKKKTASLRLKLCKHCKGFIRADFMAQHNREFHSGSQKGSGKVKKGWVRKTCSECGETYLGRKNYDGVPLCLDCGEDIFEAGKRGPKRKKR